MLVTDLGLHAGYKPTLSALHGWMLLPLSHKAHTSQLSHIYVTLAFRTMSEGFMLLIDLLCLALQARLVGAAAQSQGPYISNLTHLCHACFQDIE